MAQMKMRTKITGGFFLMMVLLLAVSIVAVIFLGRASKDFEQYRDWATDSNLLSTMQEDMLMVRMNVKDFLIRGEAQDKREFDSHYERVGELITEAKENIKNKERAPLVQEIDKSLIKYGEYFEKVVELQGHRDTLVVEGLDVTGPEIETNITDILRSAEVDNDMEAAFYASLSLRNLLLARLYAFKFLDSNTEEDEARVIGELEKLESNINELDKRLENADRRDLLAKVEGGFDEYSRYFEEVTGVLYERNNIVDTYLDVIGPEIADTGAEIVSSIQADQDILGPKLEKANQTAIMISLIVSAIAIVLGILLTIFISSSILKQLGADPAEIEKITGRIAEGDLQIDVSNNNARGVYLSVKEMVEALRYKGEIVEKISNKDLSVDIRMASEKDQLGRSLIVMKDALNEVLMQVNTAVEQVANGSDQVSQASQNLSQGATEQAGSLEEITSSTNEINNQSKQNAENAQEAHAIAKQATKDAEGGNEKMMQLSTIMEKINASSDEINKVVKVIDDIAFQINLLALNANVEAARAGKYGKGFAVVADEVRNLAVKSADSVKETTRMVEETVANIKSGTEATDATAQQLSSIVEGSGKVANFLEGIAEASKEQAQAIEQITEGLDQIDEATQANTAGAEESASASEELAGQAQQLRSMVAQFKLENGTRSISQAITTGDEIKKIEHSWEGDAKRDGNNSPVKSISLDDDEFDRFSE